MHSSTVHNGSLRSANDNEDIEPNTCCMCFRHAVIVVGMVRIRIYAGSFNSKKFVDCIEAIIEQSLWHLL